MTDQRIEMLARVLPSVAVGLGAIATLGQLVYRISRDWLTKKRGLHIFSSSKPVERNLLVSDEASGKTAVCLCVELHNLSKLPVSVGDHVMICKGLWPRKHKVNIVHFASDELIEVLGMKPLDIFGLPIFIPGEKNVPGKFVGTVDGSLTVGMEYTVRLRLSGPGLEKVQKDYRVRCIKHTPRPFILEA